MRAVGGYGVDLAALVDQQDIPPFHLYHTPGPLGQFGFGQHFDPARLLAAHPASSCLRFSTSSQRWPIQKRPQSPPLVCRARRA